MKLTDVLISLGLMAFAIAVVVLALTIAPHAANAQQHDHDLYHAQYRNWLSNGGTNCCNSSDCGVIAEDHLRMNGGRIEVKVEDIRGDQWCPVEWNHLIDQTKGKRPSPNWSVAHACIRPWMQGESSVCDRMKCFMDEARD